jgi:hypothetical protein
MSSLKSLPKNQSPYGAFEALVTMFNEYFLIFYLH